MPLFSPCQATHLVVNWRNIAIAQSKDDATNGQVHNSDWSNSRGVRISCHAESYATRSRHRKETSVPFPMWSVIVPRLSPCREPGFNPRMSQITLREAANGNHKRD